jgi:Fe-Mn family superoxide dismutase
MPRVFLKIQGEMHMLRLSRRQLLKVAGAGAATLALAPLARFAVRAEEKKAAAPGFTLPPLPYAYDALQPSISEEIMKLHHDTHHAAYVTNLNKALEGHDDLLKMSIDELLRNSDKITDKARQTAVINNGGGHANHSLFWEVMGPKAGGEPKGDLAKAIDASFGSFDKFQQTMAQAGVTRFGSGWAWLVPGKEKLEVFSTANQDSPLLKGQTPILGLDVWEHAYYLQYKAKRADYIAAWWKVVNWSNVAERYSKAKA